MKSYLVVVVDAARARLLRWQGSDDVSLDGYPQLVELEDLVNPEGRLMDREVFSNEITNNRTTGPGPAHSKDDHREANRRESLRRFIRDLSVRADEHITRERPARVVLVSETHVLHELRRELEARLPRGVQVVEIPENLGKASLTDVHQALARKGLVPPPPKGPTPDQFVPRGQPRP